MSATEKYRVTKIDKSGNRRVSNLTEKELQLFRAKRLKTIRKEELGLTQKVFAEAVGVKLRTLQDWELGRSHMAKPVEILMTLMRDIPTVKKKLLANV